MKKNKIFFLIGLPGSGKTTLSKALSTSLGFSVISSNTILEEDSQSNGNYLKETYVDHGISIPDDLYVYLVTKCIKKDENDKFIIEGFPYNLNQLKLAQKMLKQTSSELCGVIYLECNEEVLYERLMNRTVCPICNQSFNSSVKICPECNVDTVKRNDDDLLIINRRIENQKNELQEVIDYYQKKEKLLIFNEQSIDKIDSKMQKIKQL